MSFTKLTSGPFETNGYVLFCPTTNEAALIDAPPESKDLYVNALEKIGAKPRYLLFTHSHWDHTADAAALLRTYPMQSAIHPLDAPNLQNPGTDGLPCWIAIEGVSPAIPLKEGLEIPLGKLKIQVIETPGHTPGGVCFYLPDQHLLFSGDTLFQGTIGNLSFPTARPELMWKSLAKLAKLPQETRVLPGHGPETTIGKESWLDRAETLFG